MVSNAWSPNIKDKVFLVTGGAAGVGAAVVRSLLADDARCVVFLDVLDREGTALETELLQKFGALQAKFIKCDISDENQLEVAFRQVLDKYRKLDVVINNAAILGVDKLFKKMIDINFTATVSCTIKALEIMSEETGGCGGTVLNLSSMLALKHHSHLPVYSATKAAVLQFSNSLGTEEYYSKTKVRVMTVCLGPTDTAILQRQNLENFDKDCTSLASRVPVRQSVESAAKGIIEVIKYGTAGSAWVVVDEKPPKDISKNLKDAFSSLPRDATGVLKPEPAE
ncbi:15-hydroxyprostaglandin dehydrogenase [NAD(+)]-like [Hyposmocoma kahamanoa]|uniref:15-hydroxyprostaglandin dehydrogenase [NAD(+)]-like n=1 Tax=Hyposmocoma kahamanoa TaxID=1477025 RepID=UPI000E6D9264|nr:15-hydroxyprostaglandin dehydrogenase [NAD(+)]-like [Hyposmocoma kahamanoa]